MTPRGYPSPSQARNLAQLFRRPPPGWGAVPFWWWSGDRLDPRRLRWQLDQLRPAGLAGLQVNYSHAVGGGHSFGLTDSSEPRLLTPAWMRIWRGVARDCKRRGFGLGLSDYTLSWPDQGTWTGSTLPPAARAAQVLRLIEVAAEGGQRLDLALPADVVAVTALPQGSQDPAQLRDLAMHMADGRLRWRVAAGRWRILIVHVALDRIRIDACHPGSGRAMLDGVHRPCAEAAGGAGNFFFQDEFFQPKEPVWHRSLLSAIAEARLLPALLTDLGDHGTALRLRWAEATARRMQRCFFAPIGRWHASRGLLYGCDQPSRGGDPAEYGDYLGALRHFTAPGHDVPAGGISVFKAKCSSSAAHLARQPRVWMEAYYGAGWGFAPGRILSDTLGNFAAGCNLLSLHGLYYSTRGGFWEWAPPCFHWRQPYWTHFTRFLRGIGRLGFVLAQGVHRCDVAVVYPTAPAQAGVPSEQAVATCRAIVEGLWARGIDCDVVDRQGLDEAEIVDGTLRVAGEIYRTLVLPGLTATHAIAAQRACELHAAGGQVLAVEPLPSTSELGSDDPWLTGVRQLPRYADATAALTALAELPCDFRGPDGAVACHRQAGGREIYQIVGAPGGSSCWFRASGRIELWDVWSGKRRAWPHAVAEDGGTRVVLPAEGAPGGGWLVVFTPAQAARYRPLPAATPVQRVPLTGTWDFQLRPTLDNRWGDFRLPIEQRMLGAEIRRFRVAGGGREVDPGFGARFLRFSGDADGAVLAAARSAADLAHLASTPVDLSWRWGVPGDLGPQGWHGNKASIGDDMFALGERQEASWPGDHNACTYRDTGPCWLWTTVITTRQTMARLVAGGVQPERVLINGRAFAPGAVLALDPGPTAVLARYTSAGRAYLVLIDQDHPDPQRQDLSSCWQGHPGLLALDPRPLDAPPEQLEALAPPGLREIRGRIHGSCTARIGGQRAAVAYGRADAAGWRTVTITVRKPSPDPIAVELAVQGSPGYGGSAAFAGPLALDCGPGRLAAGDWSEVGALADYSGSAIYARDLTVATPDRAAVLDLGQVSATARVLVNGREAGVLLAAPWRVRIGHLLKRGRNRLEIEVASTLGNHYRTLPTRYRGPIEAGLIGPVVVETAR